MKKTTIYSFLLLFVTALNLWFYKNFKPPSSLINIGMSQVFDSSGREITGAFILVQWFIEGFGDGLAVLMVLFGLGAIMHAINYSDKQPLYRFVIVPFLIFEIAQIWLPGNFLWIDMFMYLSFYGFGLWVISRIEKPVHKIDKH